MKLFRSQKNQIFDMIIKEGLRPSQFAFKEVTRKGESHYTLVLEDSNFYFRFKFTPGPSPLLFYAMGRSPGEKTPVDTQMYHEDWDSLTADLSNWLKLVKREVEEPDKWEQIYESSKHISWKTGQEENTLFTFTEVDEIQMAVERVKHRIVQMGLLPDHLAVINAKLDYLAEKSKSLGRVDWKNILIGTLITVVVELSLPPETAKTLWSLFKEVFHGIMLISLR
jgi:hypothetical protein